jgi:PAS domain S-box-containing protein
MREVRDLQLDELRAAALDACIVPVIVYTEEMRFVYVNPAGRKLFALGDKDDLDVDGLDLVAERSQGESALDELFSTGAWRGAIRGRSRDGRLLDLIASGRLVGQDDERFIVCSVIDSTELVELRAEAQSRQSEQVRRASREWEQTFDAIEQPVLILGSRGHVLRLNRATLAALGVESFEQALGRELWQFAGGELWVTVQRMVARLQSGERVDSRKLVDGARSWLVSVAPVPDRESEGEHGTVVYLRDMTESDRLEASLRQAERMAELGSLVAGVAHEVRNPLFGISAIVDALKSGAIPPDELPESLDLLRSEVDRLNRLASGLLEFGKPVPAPQDRHAVSSLVEEVMRECSATAREKRVVFLFSGFTGLPTVSVDRRSILTALRNLVENAIQHAPEESEIRLQGRRLDGDQVELEVRDHGPGFPEQERERLLQPFFSRRPGGTGLGLSIAANVVRQHGGRLTLGNAEDGGGRVLVSLPLDRPPAVGEVGA